VCNARAVDGLVIVFVALQAVALAIALGYAWSRGRTLEEIDESLREAEGGVPGERTAGGAGGSSEALVDRLRKLRRRAESAEFGLEQRLRDLAYLADLVGVGIVRLSDDLRVEIANTAAHVFLRREPGSMLGRTAIEALGDHRVEAIARGAREAGWSSGEVTLADREPGGAGGTLVVRARRSPILGVWLVLEDVAELRRLQRIRAEFIDNLSHELRTPITTVGLLVESLTRDAETAAEAGTPVPGKMRDRIGKLEVETGNIAQMVAELLDLARIESGGRQLHLDDVDLGRIATDSAERLRPFADRQGVTLRVLVDPDLPPVRGEAARLAQVFANLVHNAVKFSSSGTEVRVGVQREPEVSPTASRPRSAGPTMLVGWVSDDGPGVAASDQPRIFERFYKADRTRSGGGGTGLGLAIARHIVEGHGGVIRVESEEGRGATFMFTIPVSDAPAERQASTERSAVPARAAGG
jgi:two-component system, OmpR family, phosphate regulon sensor histidine kinase PhoR